MRSRAILSTSRTLATSVFIAIGNRAPSAWLLRSAAPGLGMVKPRREKSTIAIDDHVGARIRERRIMLGKTQQQLADLIGVTYQQEHKYERGLNRVSAGRLFEIARVLGVPVDYFFEGLGEEGARLETPRERMLLEIARNFAAITDERQQDAVNQLARALAETH
jgi:transcriptional regulator with XRE-family HTH domain